MRYLFIILLSFSIVEAKKKPEKPIIVAVIDTGFDFKSKWKKKKKDDEGNVLRRPKICRSGHKDFTNTKLKDNHNHGTHIAGVIAKHAKNSNYCIIVLKYFNTGEFSGRMHQKFMIDALKYAIEKKVDIINYSGGGPHISVKEHKLVKKALDMGIVLVFAAGNDSIKIDHNVLKIETTKKNNIIKNNIFYINRRTNEIISKFSGNLEMDSFYPAAYDPRIIAVSNVFIVKGKKKNKKKRMPSSNYGDAIQYEENGREVFSILPDNSYGYMTGTSQSAAVRTGKIIKKWVK